MQSFPNDARVVFCDFDGVVKDSVAVKSVAFQRLFEHCGPAIIERVRRHHEAHGGVSRYEKIRLYLQWVGEASTEARVAELAAQFSTLVRQAVIDSAWVPGVCEFLGRHSVRQNFVLVTATPQEEIQVILRTLNIAQHFREVHGAPTPKAVAVKDVLLRLNCAPSQAVLIGDAMTDLEAADANSVAFLLRRTAFNRDMHRACEGRMFDDWTQFA